MSIKNNKSVLITGCSSGIGYICAKGLRKRGYRVFATARQQKDVDALINEGFESLLLDLNCSESIHTAINDILERTQGNLYALFNNGAYGQPGAVEDLPREALRANFETNLFGTHELTTLVIPIMRKQGYGRIVQNSSVLGLIALRFRGAYNATKFALEGLTDTLRHEIADTNIQISLIEPGPITSRFRENAFAAYKRYIDPTHSAFRETYKELESRLEKQGPTAPFTLPPEAVFKKLIHALESPKPKIRYYVTFPTYLFATLKRVLPHSSLDHILRKVSKSENRSS